MQTQTANHPALWQHLLPRPDASSHKYRRGYALIQGGYPITGAARLAALAAARIGAGMTAIAVPEIAFPIYASQLLSIMAKPYANAEQRTALINDNRVSAYLIGPGAGVAEETAAITLQMLRTGKPVVIDADALTSFAACVDKLTQTITATCVLTPHDGEFSRLFGVTPAHELSLRITQTQTAASQTGAVVLLKGSQTLIAAPDGRLLVNDNAPPTLATAGAGDVLAGIITGLLAQGMPAFEACAASAWLHAEAANLFGAGLIAEDLPGLLPAAIRQCQHT